MFRPCPVHNSAALICCDGDFFDQDRYRSPAISSLYPTAPLTRFVAQRFSWVCALWLHLALFAVATDASLWRSGPPHPELVPQETVSVEIVTDRLVRPLPDPSPDPAAGPVGARPYPAEPGAASLTRPPASGRGSISAQP
ncbi:hypothetical protein, partial [Roseibium sp.]|uniref:hypothetical protein n=1 Tax=Roseibium sp. TaxID=1936156 RepID=UPI003299FE09